MFTLLRKRSFALLWFGGLISIMGDRVLAVALPFYVYQQSGSTLVTAILVAATLIPRFMLGSIAGVMVDRWDRKKIMVTASLAQALLILPLLWVHSSATLWVAYLVSFFQTVLAVFFSPAENALLPQLVEKEQLLPANALNALNNNIARLIGPPVGGLILAVYGLPGVVLFDSLTFLIAAGLIAGIRPPVLPKPTASSEASSAAGAWAARLRKEWLEGIALIHTDHGLSMLFLVVILINFGGVMIDPLSAPFVADVVRTNAQTYGYLMTTQAVGGITGGLIAARAGLRLSPARVAGWGTVMVGLLQLFRYNTPTLPVVFTTALLIGLPAAMLGAALDTLFQQMVPNSHLGRIVGALETIISVVSLIGVLGIAGALGERLGIVTVLNFAALVTVTAGVLALLFLPARVESSVPGTAGEKALDRSE